MTYKAGGGHVEVKSLVNGGGTDCKGLFTQDGLDKAAEEAGVDLGEIVVAQKKKPGLLKRIFGKE